MREVDRLNVRTSWRRPLRYSEHVAKSRRAVLSGPPYECVKKPTFYRGARILRQAQDERSW